MARQNPEARPRAALLGGFLGRVRALYRSMRRDNLLRLVFFVSLLVLAGGTLVYLVEMPKNRDMFGRLFDSIWWAVTTITTVGYGDRYPVTNLGRVLGMSMMLLGIVSTSILSGTIASIFVDRKIREGKGLQDVNLRSHVIICGWNRHTEGILEGLTRLTGGDRKAVVLVNELDPEEFQSLSARFPSLDLRFVRGDFVNEKVLRRASIATAAAAVMVTDTSGANTTANADERTILASLAVKSLNADIAISAEVINPDNVQHLKRANVDEVVVDGEFTSFLLANSTLYSGIPRMAKEILSFDSRSFIRQMTVPPAFVGKTFAELSAHYLQSGAGVLVGFLSEDRKMSLDDILSEGSSAIDAFIKQKFAEAQLDVFDGEKEEMNIKMNPGPDYVVQDTDTAFLIGTVEREA